MTLIGIKFVENDLLQYFDNNTGYQLIITKKTFLNTGVIFALTQSRGRIPSDNDLLYRVARGLASLVAPSFRR